MSSLLEHPTAQDLLEQTTVSPPAIRHAVERLDAFLERYRPRFARTEQRDHAAVILRGKLSGLDRKTIEPIAADAGVPRRAVQHFVGAGPWCDDAVRAELHTHVTQTIGDPEAVLIVDGLAVPKKGDDSCGVYRQWCGRLGKVENCQTGVFLGYAARGGQALLDARLYLPRERAADRCHRQTTHVPAGVALLRTYHVRGWASQLRITTSRSRGPALPSSSLACTIASTAFTRRGPFAPARTVTVRQARAGCRAAHAAAFSQGGTRAPAGRAACRSRINVLPGTSST